MRNIRPGPAYGLTDASGSLDMIILNHHSIVQAEPVVRPAANADGILLQHPVSRRGLAGINQPCRQTIQRFYKSGRP
ncbi:hypothetical protein D3C75_1232970 [compost metagenome]